MDVEYSRRVNPIQAKYINNLAAASETAETLLEKRGKSAGDAADNDAGELAPGRFKAKYAAKILDRLPPTSCRKDSS